MQFSTVHGSIKNFESDVIERGPNRGQILITFEKEDGNEHIFRLSREQAKDLFADIDDTLHIKLGD